MTGMLVAFSEYHVRSQRLDMVSIQAPPSTGWNTIGTIIRTFPAPALLATLLPRASIVR
jgi:hypothetical protein